MIEDGDIGYVGEYHASFVRARAPRTGGPATQSGSSACAQLVAFLREKFKREAPARIARRVDQVEVSALKRRAFGAA